MLKKLKKQLAETNTNYENLLKDYEALTAKQKQESQEKQEQQKSLNESFNTLKKNLQALEKQLPMPLVATDVAKSETDVNQNSKKASRKRSSSSIDSLTPKLPYYELWAPASVKLTGADEGALLSWSFPVTNTEIIEYEVDLEFRSVSSPVYKGKLPKCSINNLCNLEAFKLFEVLPFLLKVKTQCNLGCKSN